jgi:hypothetical protein
MRYLAHGVHDETELAKLRVLAHPVRVRVARCLPPARGSALRADQPQKCPLMPFEVMI